MGWGGTYKWHSWTSGAGRLNSPKMVYYSMLKWSGEQGVVVSEASELLFEGIKKLNAQQRPDVPACFIYTAISYVLMSTKTLYAIFLLRTSRGLFNTCCNTPWFWLLLMLLDRNVKARLRSKNRMIQDRFYYCFLIELCTKSCGKKWSDFYFVPCQLFDLCSKQD